MGTRRLGNGVLAFQICVKPDLVLCIHAHLLLAVPVLITICEILIQGFFRDSPEFTHLNTLELSFPQQPHHERLFDLHDFCHLIGAVDCCVTVFIAITIFCIFHNKFSFYLVSFRRPNPLGRIKIVYVLILYLLLIYKIVQLYLHHYLLS